MPIVGSIFSLNSPSLLNRIDFCLVSDDFKASNGLTTFGKYDLWLIFFKFSKHVCVFNLHWLKSSVDKLFSTKINVIELSSCCEWTSVENSSDSKRFNDGKKEVGLKKDKIKKQP